MIKTISLLIVFLGSSYIGVEISNSYSKKEKFFREIIMFCDMLINNIGFNKNKIGVVIENNLDNYSGDLKDCLSSYIAEKSIDVEFLNKYQNQKINDFFNGLGGFDVGSEINYINSYKLIFEDFYEKGKDENKRYGTLYSKIGIIVGLILVILFV